MGRDLQQHTLTQAEADRLIALEKWAAAVGTVYQLPMAGAKVTIPLLSADAKEAFILDVNRAGKLAVTFRVTHQIRGRDVIPLVRLDVGGPDHFNPDGVKIPCPHIHHYREGYGDRWATALPDASFGTFFQKLTEFQTIFGDFLSHCRVVRPPTVNFPLL